MVLLEFKMAAMDELHSFCGRKTQKSHYPPSGNVEVILLKFKMTTTF